MKRFDLDLAFSRNLGWLTEQDQSRLRSKRVAIAGLGGVGGAHLLTLARLGVGAFTLADFDVFETANFNRQVGATVSHLGHPKIEVMAKMARDINPHVDLRLFPKGINAQNANAFLDGVDIYLDGLDYFAVETRRMIFARCADLRIPGVTVAPVGMGAALLNFLPGKMTFDQYFQMQGSNKVDDLVRFLIGLTPRMLQMASLRDDTRTDFEAERVPSTPMGCELAAGVAATEVLKILLNRGDVICAPRSVHFDAYRNRLARTWRPWGNRNPLQKIVFHLARKKFASKIAGGGRPTDSEDLQGASTPAQRVLQSARWAPSGDNLQQWRFQVLGDTEFLVLGDNYSRDVYFLNDWPKLLALGGLLETIGIAATGEGRKAICERQVGNADRDREIIYRVQLVEDGGIAESPLLPFIKSRTTQRRALSLAPIASSCRRTLDRAVTPYRIMWLDTAPQRRAMARLSSQYAKIRLTIPEAYDVHKKVIQWNARFSADRIPDQAIGLDTLTLKMMRWAMRSWSRVNFLNTYLAGTLMARFQLDLIPGRNCAAYVALLAPRPPEEIPDFLEAGRMMQRFWLTATRLGLQFQPQMAPLIFDSYVRDGIAFTSHEGMLKKASALSPRLRNLLGAADYSQVTFLGRIGFGPEPRARSLRRPLSDLLVT